MKTSLTFSVVLLAFLLFQSACQDPNFFYEEVQVFSEQEFTVSKAQVSLPGPGQTQPYIALTLQDGSFSQALAELLEKNQAIDHSLDVIRFGSPVLKAASPAAPAASLWGIDSVVVHARSPFDQEWVRVAWLPWNSGSL